MMAQMAHSAQLCVLWILETVCARRMKRRLVVKGVKVFLLKYFKVYQVHQAFLSLECATLARMFVSLEVLECASNVSLAV